MTALLSTARYQTWMKANSKYHTEKVNLHHRRQSVMQEFEQIFRFLASAKVVDVEIAVLGKPYHDEQV